MFVFEELVFVIGVFWWVDECIIILLLDVCNKIKSCVFFSDLLIYEFKNEEIIVVILCVCI